jgi:hypothetical protein
MDLDNLAGFALIPLLVGIFVLIAWLVAVSMFVEIARNKGVSATGALWFIGIFASPLVLGLYVIALPDEKRTQIVANSASDDELPSL